MRNFGLAWLQVTLISLNTWQIANKKIVGALIVGFLISLVWTFNVQDISKSNLYVKMLYALGAMLGTATGLVLTFIFYNE
jgi:hypothetical protein